MTFHGRNLGVLCGLFSNMDAVIIKESMHAFVVLDQLQLKAVSACNSVKFKFN